MSPKKRAALRAVYAFCRAADDSVDEPGSSDPRENLLFWRAELDRIYGGNPCSETGGNLLEPVRAFGLRKEHFLLLFEGLEKDTGPVRYRTMAELEWYMYRVAAAPGMLCSAIFCSGHAVQTEEYARSLGFAMQLTNIIRDLDADAAIGRIYLPLEDLQRFSLSENDILSCTRTPDVAGLLRFEAERAKKHYAEARLALNPGDRFAMFPAGVMSALYEGMLERMADSGFAACGGKAGLSATGKISCIFKALAALFVARPTTTGGKYK